jgi:hypothetical protein
MDETYKQFLNSGKRILHDTKAPRRPETTVAKGKADKGPAKPAPSNMSDDPHKVFIRRVVGEKPKKQDIVDQIKQFIEIAESDL